VTLSPRLDGLLLSLVAQRHDGDEEEARQVYESTLRRLAWRQGRGHKVCDSCREAKRPAAFGQESRNTDGLARRCLKCDRRRKALSRTDGGLL
jgi:hypothetical protein